MEIYVIKRLLNGEFNVNRKIKIIDKCNKLRSCRLITADSVITIIDGRNYAYSYSYRNLLAITQARRVIALGL